MPWGAIIGSVAGAALAGSAADRAASKASDASNYASDLQYQQWLRQQELQAPWRGTGENALSQLALGLGITPYIEAPTRDQFMTSVRSPYVNIQGANIRFPGRAKQVFDEAAYNRAMEEYEAKKQAYAQSPELGSLTRQYTSADIEADPIYQQMLAQGLKTGTTAIDRLSAARGTYGSGSRLKALTEYGQGLAASEGMNAYNRFNQQRMNRLAALQSAAGLGQTATGQLGSAGSSYAANVGDLAAQNAATQGQAGIAQANLWGSAMQGIGTSLGDWYQQQQNKKTVDPANTEDW